MTVCTARTQENLHNYSKYQQSRTTPFIESHVRKEPYQRGMSIPYFPSL